MFSMFRACASRLEARCPLLRTSWPPPPPPSRAWGSPRGCEVSSLFSTHNSLYRIKAPARHNCFPAKSSLHWGSVLEAPHLVFSLKCTTNQHNMERTWQNWRRLFSERDDISQSLLSGNHFHRYGDKKHKSHAFLKPNHLHSCHQWISLNLCIFTFQFKPVLNVWFHESPF